jgi:hypothetical protein
MPDNTAKEDDRCIMHTEKIHELELSMVEIKGDVRHIRERIDNGLSATISKIWDKMNTMAVDRVKMETMVAGNSSFVDKLRGAIIWVSVIGIAGGVLGVAWKVVHAYISNNT